MPFDLPLSRRRIFQLLAASAALAVRPSLAGEARIDRLIVKAREFGTISKRIDFISAALRGTRYQGYTLIGGPKRPEQFVVRDDAFDCVTYCETVLAAAIARDASEFAPHLRAIRYYQGIVRWNLRNHYFFQWCERNVENKTCRWIDLPGAVDIKKTVDSQKGLSKRTFAMHVIPRAVLLANKKKLETGDIIGFVSQRANLDYFHTGFIAFAHDGTLLLRHASESRRRVLDERMDHFIAFNRVRYVTLLRPLEPTQVA